MSIDVEILSVLNDINSGLKDTSPAWIAALIGVVGAISGAFVMGYWQYKSTKNNNLTERDNKRLEIKAEIITKQRQEWMNELRNTCKTLLSAIDLLVENYDETLSDNEYNALYRSYSENGTLMILMLNSKKKKQRRAIDLIHKIQNVFSDKNRSKEDVDNLYGPLRDSLLIEFEKIFQKTWKKISCLE